MSALVNIAVHPSQFPAQARRDLLESLRSRQIRPRLLYETFKQSQKWLALHEAFSPSRTDPACSAIYQRGFEAASERVAGKSIHLVGLGCGGGQKEALLLQLLRAENVQAAYVPVDVSLPLLLSAQQAARAAAPDVECFPLLCDLGAADDLLQALEDVQKAGGRFVATSRLCSCFGVAPNFEPQVLLPRLAQLVRPGDWLLFSANLAPGPDYSAGVRKILPLYDNALTRDWLMTFLLDLGIEKGDGQLRFEIAEEPFGSGLRGVFVSFNFASSRELRVDEERFAFRAGDTLKVFYSYRHTPALVAKLFKAHGLAVSAQWIAPSEEEGVFLLGRK